MEPTVAAGQVDLRGLQLETLRQAVDIYLGLAYPSGVLPSPVERRLTWPADVDAQDLLNRHPFERADKVGDCESPVYALRLGNGRYPHMKLQIQPWPNDAGFMLSVKTHDQVSGLKLGAADAHAFLELQAENQRLKEAIEQAWDGAGLPTFLRYLRDYIQSRTGCSSAESAAASSEISPASTKPVPLL